MTIQHFRHSLLLRMGLLSLPTVLSLALAAHGLTGSGNQTHWIGSWAASPQLLAAGDSLKTEDQRDATLRQVVHLSFGGAHIRLRLSNRFGGTPLHLTAVHVARALSPDSERIAPATDTALTFSGSPDTTIPAHADCVSDPVSFSVNAFSDLAITLHIDGTPAEQTGHSGARATSYVAQRDLVSAPNFSDAKTTEHWYFISGVDVTGPAEAGSIVVLGDSITDGHGATTNGNDRWTDMLAKRLQSSPTTRNLAVLNQGIGGNRLLLDGLGPNALSRFDEDVIAQSAVRYVIVLEGINDIGVVGRSGTAAPAEREALVRRIIGAYEQMVKRAHAHDIKVIGATLMPFVGSSYYHPNSDTEADRQSINEWIRGEGHFDHVVDFDEILHDPDHPDRLLPAFDSGDHLHPSPAGYAAMAEGVPLALFMASPDQDPKIAITFDDLPAHGPLPAGETRMDVVSKIIAALQNASLPPTYGFVNGAGLEAQPGDVEVLRAWHAAGNPLANHSWSHMNLNQHSLKEFERDVIRNEPVLVSVMNDEDWHWFRYPFLAEGDTSAKRAQFRDFLRQRGYRVASVTMTFGDYLWNEPYTRCKAKGDTAAIAALEDSYLAAADESITYYRGIAQRLYQRDIPYVLLMHVGAFDAEVLPRLLQLYRTKGFEFVTLPDAERDTFYKVSTSLNLPPGPDTIEEATSERRLSLPPRTNFAAQLDSLCR